MDIYLLEAIINGILLGGVLALLALGLNPIFGVIDVVRIAYADIVMCGMYLLALRRAGLAAAARLRRRNRRRGGARRSRASPSSPPFSARRRSIALTGGCCSSCRLRDATVRHRAPQHRRLPIIESATSISAMRSCWPSRWRLGAVALFLLRRTFIGTVIRAIAQTDIVGLMGVDQRRAYLVTSAIGGALAGSPPVSCHCSTTSIPSSEYVRTAHLHDLRARRAL
jgi:branched-chain amino acid transport system permease protein